MKVAGGGEGLCAGGCAPVLPKLTLGQRVAYGAGELGPAMAGSTLVFFQMIFLTDVAGLEPGWAGSVMLIARVWDAVNDPLIGWLSDRTRHRWGRRLPWMVAGVLPFAVLFCAFWLGPLWLAGVGQAGLFAYYSTVAVLYSTVTTALALPHSALTAELSHDYDERSRLTSARMGFSLAGSVGGLVLALVVFRALPEATALVRYVVFGCAVAVVGLAAVGWCLAGIWGVAQEAERWRLGHTGDKSGMMGAMGTGDGGGREPLRDDRKGLWMMAGLGAAIEQTRKELGTVVGNRPFLLVCGVYLCSWLAMQFTAGVLPFYTAAVMGLSETTFQTLALTVQATALALMPVWLKVALRKGKKEVYFYGMGFWIAAQAGLLFLPKGEAGVLFGLAVLAGVGISVCYLIPNALLPDVIEWDELRTGRRREGLYFGFCVFLQKVALALGAFIVGQILQAAGYVAGAGPEGQPESALVAIRWAIGPLPAGLLVAGLVVAWFYPISRRKHAQLVRALERRARRGGGGRAC